MVRERAIRLALLHPLRTWVDALETLLAGHPGVEIVVAQTSLTWVRHALRDDAADVLLVHVQAADPAMIEDLLGAHPQLRIIAMGEDADTDQLPAWVRAGARGWVEQTASFDHLLAAIRGVHNSENWIPRRVMTAVVEGLLAEQQMRQQESEILGALSARELEVLSCLAAGMTRQEIADRYVVSPHTIRTHINNVLRKLDVHSTLAAVSIARQVGLVAPLPPQRDSGSPSARSRSL